MAIRKYRSKTKGKNKVRVPAAVGTAFENEIDINKSV